MAGTPPSTPGDGDSTFRITFRRHFSFNSPMDVSTVNNREKRSASGSSSVMQAPLLLSRYFSRRHEQHSTLKEHSLLLNPSANEKFIGIYSPVAAFWGFVFLTIPAAYMYIALVVLRELCRTFPETIYRPIQSYTPWLAYTVMALNHVSRIVEIWCWLEAVFFIGLKLHIKYLQTRDPLEASLSAAPMMELLDRSVLWDRMMDCEASDPISFLRGWFFDQPLENISKYDVRDFIAWSLFEGRHQEHLTDAELRQLERFVEEVEHRFSLCLYGELKVEAATMTSEDDDFSDSLDADFEDVKISQRIPLKRFQFSEETQTDDSNYFSDLYESYRKAYDEKMKTMRNATADFRPVQSLQNMVNDAAAAADIHFQPVKDFRNLMVETGKTIEKAEETAMLTATHVYESLVPAGSQMDKQLTALSNVPHSTYVQMIEAWNSVKNMSERLETARFLRKQRQRIRQQLKGYRELLNQMRDMSHAVPSKQMASMMRRITECNEAMAVLENRAQTAFVKATGFAIKKIPFFPERRKPQRFAKYSSDPLLGIATYPLGFHLLVLGLTEIPLRLLMFKRGFERRVMGPVAYYFYPGKVADCEDEDETIADKTHMGKVDTAPTEGTTPIVFVHGIGIGLIIYMPLIDALMATGRPILLPEIPYVSGFRPFQSPNGVLPPAVVCSTMTAMLASHGYLSATWIGHSYGTSWLSYMCKYAPNAVAALLFLDPICFCLHVPYLTKQFVYLRPDPGTVSYMVRTDVIVNWTIQRSFPWAWIILFTEQIKVPCIVFLSAKDALVPAAKIEEYFKSKHVPVQNFQSCNEESFFEGEVNECQNQETQNVPLQGDKAVTGPLLPLLNESRHNLYSDGRPKITCVIFREDGHGDWTDRPSSTIPTIVGAAKALCRRVETLKKK